ncbi:MAG: SAVED domain-containing protein [Bacteroidales bacterium]|jgi:hypothetical protein|nr:SAVED domain-containing protein [Bacteroidales bacterium]
MAIIQRVRKAIPARTARKLWVKAGGRCEYIGCNIPLWKDSLTQRNMNKAYISHIIGAKENGPRGDKILSEPLELSFENLMLLCDECHNRIDEAQKNEHSVSYLQKMKKDHEERIELLTGLTPEKKTHIILYGAKIGNHQSPLNFSSAVRAILPVRFPTSDRPIEIGISNSEFEDNTKEYWDFQSEQLRKAFERKLQPLLGSDPIQHFSVFGLAPQPLLIKFGTLLSEIYPADVYQLHREPNTWQWLDEPVNNDFIIIEPDSKTGTPVLLLSLSVTVTDDRIERVLGSNVSIWRITVKAPNNDFLKASSQLSEFRKLIRSIFDRIKAYHGKEQPLHIFPAMPLSCAIELGRIWMPKADMSLVLYDENHKNGGFVKTIEINCLNKEIIE